MALPINNLDDYEHHCEIGNGYFCLVQEFRHKGDGSKVAVKSLMRRHKANADYHHRLEREIKILGQLSHENIIKMIGFGIRKDTPFYVMERATRNLSEYIYLNNSTLTLQERLHIFEPIIAAIAFAHSKGILHRDISPNNILVFEQKGLETIKLSDFGLGKILVHDSGYTRPSVSSYGNPVYAAPEQLANLKSVTVAADIFSLGRVLDFILTGKLPSVVHSSGAFGYLIKKATHSDPNTRHQTVEDFQMAYAFAKSLVIPDTDEHDEPKLAFQKDDGSIDWIKFHKFATAKRSEMKIYSDYIAVILTVLDKWKATNIYVNTVGDSINEFLDAFEKGLSQLPATGWPFSSIDDVSSLYKNIYFLTKNEDAKEFCLIKIWDYAFNGDQWSAQGLIKKFFSGNHVSDSLQQAIAMHILTSNPDYKKDRFKDITLPSIIQNVVNKKLRS